MPRKKRFDANIQIPIEKSAINKLQEMAEERRDTYTNMIRNLIYDAIEDYQYFKEAQMNDRKE